MSEKQDSNNDARAASGAINMGRDAAKTAKTVGTAAAQAASGNVAGAAATVLSDPETVRNILIILLIPVLVICLMLVFILYALPMSIYESLVSFVEYARNTWDETALSNEYGGSFFVNLCVTAARIGMGGIESLWNTISSAWSSVTNFFFGGPADGENQTESFAEDGSDLSMMDTEVSQRLAIIRKAIAINDKFYVRAKQIKDAVTSSAIQDKVKDYLFENYAKDTEFEEHWSSSINVTIEEIGTCQSEAADLLDKLEDIENDVFTATTEADRNTAIDKFNDKVTNSFPMEDNTTALSLLSLIMAQYGGNVSELQLSDLLRCMGYYKNSFGSNTLIDVGHVPASADPDAPFYASVKDWTGSFKPQYAMEEWQYYMHQLDRAELEGRDADADNYEDILNSYKDTGVALTDLVIVLDYPDLDISNLTLVDYKYDSNDSGNVEHFYYYYQNQYGTSTLVDHQKVVYHPLFGTYTYYRDMTINAKITHKDIDEITSMVGLWDGAFSN